MLLATGSDPNPAQCSDQVADRSNWLEHRNSYRDPDSARMAVTSPLPLPPSVCKRSEQNHRVFQHFEPPGQETSPGTSSEACVRIVVPVREVLDLGEPVAAVVGKVRPGAVAPRFPERLAVFVELPARKLVEGVQDLSGAAFAIAAPLPGAVPVTVIRLIRRFRTGSFRYWKVAPCPAAGVTWVGRFRSS